MEVSPFLIIFYVLGVMLLYILCRVFIKPLKWILKLGISCLVGCLVMLSANKLLSPLGISFAINPLTAMISGVLGAPGLVITHVLSVIL